MSRLSKLVERAIARFLRSQPDPVIPPSVPPGDWRGELLALHNSARVKPLAVSRALQQVAQSHAETMLQRRRRYHQDIGYLMATHGTVGENVAAGQSSAVMVFGDWMRSTGHRLNIQSREFGVVGFGRAGDYWCTVFGER